MEDTSLWGWERFFVLIENLVLQSEQQRGTATEQYASYVVEKLEVAVGNVSSWGTSCNRRIQRTPELFID